MRIGGINLVGGCAALTAFLAFAPVAGSQDWKQEKAKYEEHLEHLDHEHRFVKITEGNLRPDVLRIGPDESVGWLYYGGHSARVSFDKKVAESVTCSAPGAFTIDGDRIQSSPSSATSSSRSAGSSLASTPTAWIWAALR